jgi:hypothetical protein
MLFRIGQEKARATSIVRYAAGSSFARHVHTGGEEFLVLDGTFQDEEGDYPVGTYVRNPPGTSHAPAAKGGATIFVRLWQFRAEDRVKTVQRPGQGRSVAPRPGGATATILHEDGYEEVRMEVWHPNASVTVLNPGGLEFLLVEGDLVCMGETMEPQGWARLPAGIDLTASVGSDGATVWMKLAPLLHPDVCQF